MLVRGNGVYFLWVGGKWRAEWPWPTRREGCLPLSLRSLRVSWMGRVVPVELGDYMCKYPARLIAIKGWIGHKMHGVAPFDFNSGHACAHA